MGMACQSTTIFVRWLLFWQRAGIVTYFSNIRVPTGRKATEHVLGFLLSKKNIIG
jgi:hypothetical protein